MLIKTVNDKPDTTKRLILNIIDILGQIGVDIGTLTKRRKDRMAMALLAVGDIRSSFLEALSTDDSHFLRTRDIIKFVNEHFQENISPGSYDDIRRKDLRPLIENGIVINSSTIAAKSTNNPTRGYGLNPLFAKLLVAYNTNCWDKELSNFKATNKQLRKDLESKLDRQRLPIILPSGIELKLSYGEHNLLQKNIVEKFLPKFGFNSQVLYIGDTSKKNLFKDINTLSRLNCFELNHEELPDVIAYSKSKNILFLIEAVHSAGPMDEIRVKRLKRKLSDCPAEKLFITAFLTKKDFKKWVMDIAWETEVWISDDPNHMIHFNGYKFLETH